MRYFAIISIIFGLMSSGSILALQYHGQGTGVIQDEKGAKKPNLLLAKKKSKKKRKVRQKIITGEAKYKTKKGKGGSTSIDFDEAAIDGQRRTPAGIAITKSRPDHQYDLINLRLRWHPEMIQSTSNLETGRGR